MNTNYNLRKALYEFLNVKFDSDKQIDIPTDTKFKTIRVLPNSVVNMYISATSATQNKTSIYLEAVSKSFANEYYSDFLIKVYWDKDNKIYILNDGEEITVDAIYVEFIKGGIAETYLASTTEAIAESPLPIVSISSTNVGRLNYKDQSLTFKSEHDELVNNFNTFKTNYEAWKDTLGAFSQVDKLIPNTATETGKNRKIERFIDDGSINSSLLIDESVTEKKLIPPIVTSLRLADTSVQGVSLNSGPNLKDANNNVKIEALTKLNIEDFNNSKIIPYGVNELGEINISDWSTYMQPKLSGVSGDLLFFDESNNISNIQKNLFLLKGDIITSTSGINGANDTTVASSLLVKNLFDTKVTKINRTALNDVSFVKVSINSEGQVTSNTAVQKADLTEIIGDYYLTSSYHWDSVNGVLKLL